MFEKPTANIKANGRVPKDAATCCRTRLCARASPIETLRQITKSLASGRSLAASFFVAILSALAGENELLAGGDRVLASRFDLSHCRRSCC